MRRLSILIFTTISKKYNQNFNIRCIKYMLPVKKRKVDSEMRNFKECWTEQYFFICHNELHLAVFASGVTPDFHIAEEFVRLVPIKGRTTGV